MRAVRPFGEEVDIDVAEIAHWTDGNRERGMRRCRHGALTRPPPRLYCFSPNELLERRGGAVLGAVLVMVTGAGAGAARRATDASAR